MPYALLFEDTVSLTAGSGPDLTWLMTTSAVLILLIGGLALLFRRLVLGGLRGRAAQRDLKILDVLPLGGKRQLAVVRLYDRTFALGLGEKSVDVVAELDSAVVDHDREQRSTRSTARDGFEARLQAAKDRLLGVHEIVPQPQPQPQRQPQPRANAELAAFPGAGPQVGAPPTPPVPTVAPRQVAPTSPTSTTEFLA